MKKHILTLLYIFSLYIFSLYIFSLCNFSLCNNVNANDWNTTGVGGLKGNLTQEQIEKAWSDLASYKVYSLPNLEGKSEADIKKINEEIGSKNDQSALFVLEWVVINAINKPEERQKVASRLAGLLNEPNVSYEAKVFICSMLYRIGTPAEVPAVAKLLEDSKTADAARLFLERVPSKEATAALRNALDKLAGKRESIGVMNSLSIRQDAASVSKFIEMTQSQDNAIALAAWRAISNISNDQTSDFIAKVLKSSQKANGPVESAAIRIAVFSNNKEKTAELYSLLGNDYRTKAARMAAANWMFKNASDAEKKNLLDLWMKSSDSAKLNVVVREIGRLDDNSIELYVKSKNISEKLRLILMEDLALRQGEKMIPVMLENLKMSDPEKVRMATRILVRYNDKRIVPALIETLDSHNAEVCEIVAKTLRNMSKDSIGPQLLEALNTKPDIRNRIVPVLSDLKYYEAIDPLVVLARNADPKIYEGALEGLRGICDPDQPDLTRMFDLYLAATNDKHRDYIARAITYIAEKNPNPEDRATILLACSDTKKDDSDNYQAVTLPLFGRLGTTAVYQRIVTAQKSTNPALAAAAIRALCNWPNAEHVSELWQIVETTEAPIIRNQALRAYIRVVTLPNQRAESETLSMLKKAMAAAENIETRKLALARAATVRSLDTVKWANEYLDNADLAETAANVIVELAHHRFLRQPNKSFFEPVLKKIEATSKNRTTVENAEKARMGM